MCAFIWFRASREAGAWLISATRFREYHHIKEPFMSGI
jgi:hypothetical protein